MKQGKKKKFDLWSQRYDALVLEGNHIKKTSVFSEEHGNRTGLLVLYLYSNFYAERTEFLPCYAEETRSICCKDRSALTLENATLTLHRKALAKPLKSSSGLSKGKGGGRWCMEWLSAGSQPISICFSPVARTGFWLGTSLPCPFSLTDYVLSAA